MKLKLWFATIGALLAMPVSALAQQSSRAPDPADPRAAVPPALYESVFARTSQPKPEQGDVAPDKVWRSANDTVAGVPGHAGHGAGPAAASGHAHAWHTAPAPAPKEKPAVQPAADHSKHH
jgi:hypothetical protein